MQLREIQPRVQPQISSNFPSQKLLSALYDSRIGVLICDRRLRYKAVSKSMADMHNLPVEAHLGHFTHEIIGGLADKVVPLWENVFSSGQPMPNLDITGYLPKRPDAGHWIVNLFPLLDGRQRVAQVGCFAIEIPRHSLPSNTAPTLAGELMAARGNPLSPPKRNMLVPLSPREQEVVRLVAEGKSNKEISSTLAISVRTVETYRARLMLKLNATSIAQLVHYAIRNHIVAV